FTTAGTSTLSHSLTVTRPVTTNATTLSGSPLMISITGALPVRPPPLLGSKETRRPGAGGSFQAWLRVLDGHGQNATSNFPISACIWLDDEPAGVVVATIVRWPHMYSRPMVTNETGFQIRLA